MCSVFPETEFVSGLSTFVIRSTRWSMYTYAQLKVIYRYGGVKLRSVYPLILTSSNKKLIVMFLQWIIIIIAGKIRQTFGKLNCK